MVMHMSDQKEILNSAYDGMTPWAQAKLCKMALDLARTWPAKRRQGLLALVKGAGPANVSSSIINRKIDQLTVVRT